MEKEIVKTRIGCNHEKGGHIIHQSTCREENPVDKNPPPIIIKKHIETKTPPIPLIGAGT